MARLIHLTSLDELREMAAAWDDLWERSDVDTPISRAELVAQWMERFAPESEFHALIVEEQGAWVAALPLVRAKVLRMVNVGQLPVNTWSPPGSRLLLDPECDVDRTLDLLVTHLSKPSWDVLWLDEAPLDSPAWKSFHSACARAGIATSVMERYEVGRIDIDRNWDAFSQSWSGTFRRQTQRLARRLAEQGELRLITERCADPEMVEPWLRRGFEVEHCSWKGREGTSVLSKGMLPYFVRQGRQLAEWGQLQMTFLESAGRPIAFVYGMIAKGVHHSCKIGYDDAYAKFNPGHLLYLNLFEQFWRNPEYRAVDFAGVLTEAQRHWRPKAYRLGRVVVGPRHLFGRAMVHAHEHWWPYLRRMRRYFSRRPAISQMKAGEDSRAEAAPGSDSRVTIGKNL